MIRLGYHPATYCQHEVPVAAALEDISATGWDGFEWFPAPLEDAYADPESYRAYLRTLNLEISGLYCSCSFLDDAQVSKWQKTVDRTIEFAVAVGTEYIMFDGGSCDLPRDGQTIDRIASLANAVGQRIVVAGLVCTWHQHWGTIFEYPDEFHALMASTDPEVVKFTPDTAQLALGDFDLPVTFERYVDRMQYVHLKDLGEDRRFIELGCGTIDFAPLAAILKDAGFAGWIVTDLDYTSLDPAVSSRHNLRYLQQTLGFQGHRGATTA